MNTIDLQQEFNRLRELLPDNLSPSKDYNFSSRPSSRVEWLLGRLESNADEIKRLEEGMDRLLQVMAAEKQKRYDVKGPNFRDGKGNLFLVRCPACHRENYGPNVSSGQCSWCNWEDGDAVVEVDSPPVA